MQKASDDARRYREALEQIVAMMGPMDSEHTTQSISCDGCRFEWAEALQVAENVLQGKEAHDHWGPPVRLNPKGFPHV